jgi:hypothetical protein
MIGKMKHATYNKYILYVYTPKIFSVTDKQMRW